MSINLKPSRYASRASEDTELIYSVLDAGLFCTISFVRDGWPQQIPTGYCRVGNKLFIHASTKSGFMNAIISQKISFSVTHLDGLVLAPTAFDHSFNYRSVIGFCEGVEVTDANRKRELFCAFTDWYMPGRIADIGDPTDDEVRATKIVELDLSNAAVKVREGDAGIGEKDEPTKWVGVIPTSNGYQKPQADQTILGRVELPEYIRNHINSRS